MQSNKQLALSSLMHRIRCSSAIFKYQMLERRPAQDIFSRARRTAWQKMPRHWTSLSVVARQLHPSFSPHTLQFRRSPIHVWVVSNRAAHQEQHFLCESLLYKCCRITCRYPVHFAAGPDNPHSCFLFIYDQKLSRTQIKFGVYKGI